ncbi:DNA excision repair protein, putative [Trypanosoma brucei brucei TREU927]|uniref:DNA excision repair protein, putative n=1 Tax=Trypanosoma brucei brucei (strain 927/4 GUTat10.1) TaxID=185431 RepID=Q57UN8_TRYB2|nr:DNA excision repair protein, putative [Trypanosoma brucei brucei TREU927]AAX70681.1 DNA excision repair protein, putative [Trypanosoma brucei]AAZ12472.1 DNA excision repair protein, putative [Trypanosoma brucei brucei TREU927]
MADELSQLGVNWVEESLLRQDVEANVEARADAAAAADEAELQRRWAALEEVERTVANIQEQLSKVVAPVGTAAHKIVEEKESASVLQFSLLKAQRELESRAKALRSWQIECEARQRRRVEEAKQRKQVTEQEAVMARMRNRLSRTLQPVADVQGLQEGVGSAERVPASTNHHDYHDRLTTGMGSTPQVWWNGRIGTPNGAASVTHSNISTPSRRQRLSSSTSADVPLTPAQYSCGPVLPSAYRVTLTPSDVRSKLQKYADDSDLSIYSARCRKRKRLEGALAGLAALEAGVATANGEIKEEDTDEDSGVVVKCEGIGMSSFPKVKTEGSAHEKSGTSLLDAIDVDALMEESDDVAVEVLQKVKKEKRASAGGRKHRERENTTQNFTDRHDSIEVLRGISLASSIYQKLFDHQRDGLRWLLNLHRQRVGGILGDDMGLGKTIQIAAMLNALNHSNQLRGPSLIVTPVTVLRQWVAEMHRWAPYVRTCVMHASSASTISREKLIDSVRGTPAVLLTTYAAVREHCRLLHNACFQYVILDEGHKISNPEATVTIAAKSFPTPHRLILSGTPVQNTLKELWCLFDFVKPGLLGTLRRFEEEFEVPINASKNIRASPLALATAAETARVLHESISPFLLRRLKKQVMSDSLPEKYERVIRCPLSDSQLEAYVDLLSSSRVQRLMSNTLSYTQLMGGLDRDGRDASGCLHIAGKRFQLMRDKENKGVVRHELFCVMHELRQICNHVDIFHMRQAKDFNYTDDMENNFFLDVVNAPTATARKAGGKGTTHFSMRSNRPVNYEGSSKLQTLRQLLKLWQRGGQRALVFSQTRAMLDIIENMCEQESLTYIRMDGTTNSLRRQELMDRFNEDDRIVVALLTTRVGGVGVNLIGADRVVIFDPDWNPVTDEQARERAWRIGQTRDVGVYRLISSGTVEEAVLRRQLAKTYVTEKVLHDPKLQRFFYEQGSLSESFYLGVEYDSRVPLGKKHIVAAQELFPLLKEEHNNEEVFALTAVGHERRIRGTEEESGGASVRAKSETEKTAAASVYRVCAPRELFPSATTTSRTSSSNISETSLLQDLVDGNHVRISGVDSTAQRLACTSASHAMLRVSNVIRTFEHQTQEAFARLPRVEGS